jgi:hypothetical protein
VAGGRDANGPGSSRARALRDVPDVGVKRILGQGTFGLARRVTVIGREIIHPQKTVH